MLKRRLDRLEQVLRARTYRPQPDFAQLRRDMERAYGTLPEPSSTDRASNRVYAAALRAALRELCGDDAFGAPHDPRPPRPRPRFRPGRSHPRLPSTRLTPPGASTPACERFNIPPC